MNGFFLEGNHSIIFFDKLNLKSWQNQQKCLSELVKERSDLKLLPISNFYKK